jgi:uncharacterized protein
MLEIGDAGPHGRASATRVEDTTYRDKARPAGKVGVPTPPSSARPPIPFRQFLLKVHSRCNLRCDYCYVYQMADQGWRDQPRSMSSTTMVRAAHRIAEHAETHRLAEVRVILHGGEPLLAGRNFIGELAETFTDVVGAATSVRLSMQTNGVLLDREFLEVLLSHDIRIGVSVDGDAEAHDRHRRRPNGQGSHADVLRALALLNEPRYRPLFSGLLSTIDLVNDPVETYERLLDLAPPAVDFLMPDGNWNDPPAGRTTDTADTPYADWLIAVFDRWYRAPHKETRVRTFEEIINVLLGGRSAVESIGLSPVNLVVVETDGTVEQVDTLKSSFPGAAHTGLNVFDHDFDAAMEHPGVVARQLGIDGLCSTCRSCRVVRVCGGGLYSHRYRTGAGYRNPSVYCPDLILLIDHIRAAVAGDLAALVGADRDSVSE